VILLPNIDIDIPNQVSELLNRLDAYSYRACIVGRCVRELVGGQSVVDFDVITNASMERICAIFDNYSVNVDNIKKGEVIITVLGLPILVSPYRKGWSGDGIPVYTDDITEDLKRRDFSFNAIAYNPREGFIDPFGGMESLQPIISNAQEYQDYPDNSDNMEKQGVVKAIDADGVSPFERNPVSILQALGYYSSGEYIISSETKDAILRHKENAKNIPQSELRTELSWVIRGKRASAVLEEYADVFTVLAPEFAPLSGFDLKRPEHSYDALTHTFKSVGYASPVLTLRYAMLFHALGKPDCFSQDKGGKGHYYGHAERSWIYARRIMSRMGFSEDETDDVGFLIKNQNIEIAPDRRSLKLKLREIPPERLKLLLQFRYADLKAQSPDFEGAAMNCKRQVDAINEIVAMKECYTLQQLAVNRYDLMQKGFAANDEQAAAILERLFDVVIDAPAFNTRARLMGIAEKLAQTAFGK